MAIDGAVKFYTDGGWIPSSVVYALYSIDDRMTTDLCLGWTFAWTTTCPGPHISKLVAMWTTTKGPTMSMLQNHVASSHGFTYQLPEPLTQPTVPTPRWPHEVTLDKSPNLV